MSEARTIPIRDTRFSYRKNPGQSSRSLVISRGAGSGDKSMILQRQCHVTDCRRFNNCRMYRSVTRQGWRERIIVYPCGPRQLTSTKQQRIILVILFSMWWYQMSRQVIRTKLKETSAEKKPWLHLLMQSKSFEISIDILTVQAGHGIQLSKSVLSHQTRDIWDS
jgi:hypothetical protein